MKNKLSIISMFVMLMILLISCSSAPSSSNYSSSTHSTTTTTHTSTKPSTSTTPVIPMENLELSMANLIINVGGSYRFGVSFIPKNATELLTLKTMDSSIVKIDTGTVTGLAVGETIVYVESINGIRREANVKVLDFEDISDCTLDNWSNPSYFKTETAKISEIQLSFAAEGNAPNSAPLKLQKVEYSMKLEKTYCVLSGSHAFKIHFKIYDPNNAVVDTFIVTSPSFNVNETTTVSGGIHISWNPSNPVGIYRAELSGVSW